MGIKDWLTSTRLRSALRYLCRWLEHSLAALGVLFLVYHLGFELSVITSESMKPTLQGTNRSNGDWIVTEKVSFWFRSPRRWEIVSFLNTEGFPVFKRVVGLPGEKVAIVNYGIVVNDVPVAPPAPLQFLKYYPYGTLRKDTVMACGDGYCVLGDFSRDSNDSRFEGTVVLPKIEGRAWLIVWPPSRIRFLTQ